MSYTIHSNKIKTHFPNLDILREEEFYNFKNEKFAIRVINECIEICENANEKLGTNLSFGVLFNYTFNARAIVSSKNSIITFNLGLINRLEQIISESIELFMTENISKMTISKNNKNDLEEFSFKCCVSYICNHELAHIIQFSNKQNIYQELYSHKKSFNVKNHIYEFDADLFGCIVITFLLLKEVIEESKKINTIKLYNQLTLSLLLIANIIIEFSGYTFENIYLRENKHPHPFIRIIKCKEQILANVSNNLKLSEPYLESALDRSNKIISKTLYSDKRTLNYPKLYIENSTIITNYLTEIENQNSNYMELLRYKSQDFINDLLYMN